MIQGIIVGVQVAPRMPIKATHRPVLCSRAKPGAIAEMIQNKKHTSTEKIPSGSVSCCAWAVRFWSTPTMLVLLIGFRQGEMPSDAGAGRHDGGLVPRPCHL